MTNKQCAKNLLPGIGFVLVLIFFLSVSESDYDQAIEDNAHWCEMVKSGIWYAGQDEINRRCNQ